MLTPFYFVKIRDEPDVMAEDVNYQTEGEADESSHISKRNTVSGTVKKYVQEDTDGFKCIPCGQYWKGTLLKAAWHLSGIKGEVKACPKPERLEEADKRFLRENVKPPPRQKRPRGVMCGEKSSKRMRESMHDGQSQNPSSNTDAENDVQDARQPKLGAFVQPGGGLGRIRKDDLDDAVARFVFETGSSFKIVESKALENLLRKASEFGNASAISVPSRKKLSGPLLDRQVEQTKQQLQNALSFTKDTFGLTFISDGWEDKRRQSFLNHIVANQKASFFVACDDVSASDGKSAVGIARRMSAVMNYNTLFDAKDVVLVVTDAASSNIAAHRELSRQMPWLLFSPCIPHQVDLLLEAIGRLHWVKQDIIDKAEGIAASLTKGSYPKQKWLEKSPPKELRKPAPTRFATSFLLLRRVLELRKTLLEFFGDIDVREWFGKKGMAMEIDDWETWLRSNTDISKAWSLLDAVEPIINFLRNADKGAPYAGRVYWEFYNCMESVKECDLSEQEKDELQNCIFRRWEAAQRPIHAAAYALHPENAKADLSAESELVEGMEEVINTVYYNDETSARKARQEFYEYKEGNATFLVDGSWKKRAEELEPWQWWQRFGHYFPNLAYVARRILAQPVAASASERVWSEYEWLQSKKRLKLTNAKVMKQLFVHHNRANIAKASDYQYAPLFKTWFTDEGEVPREIANEAHEMMLDEDADEALDHHAGEEDASEEPSLSDPDLEAELSALYGIVNRGRKGRQQASEPN